MIDESDDFLSPKVGAAFQSDHALFDHTVIGRLYFSMPVAVNIIMLIIFDEIYFTYVCIIRII